MLVFQELETVKNDKSLLPGASTALRELLYFTYNPFFQIDLPSFTEGAFGELPPSVQNPPFDCIRQEAPKFLSLFVKDFNRNLERRKRILIFKDILKYCTNPERGLLFQIFQNRTIPGITAADVTTAFGADFLNARPTPPVPSQPVAPAKPKTNKKTFEPFQPLRSLGYQL